MGMTDRISTFLLFNILLMSLNTSGRQLQLGTGNSLGFFIHLLRDIIH
jgi:hypothetical protein